MVDSELVNSLSQTCSPNPLTNVIDGDSRVCASVHASSVFMSVHAAPAGGCVLARNPAPVVNGSRPQQEAAVSSMFSLTGLLCVRGTFKRDVLLKSCVDLIY